jgi:hypothetical protein
MPLCRRGRRVACHGHSYLYEFVFKKSKVNNDGRWLIYTYTQRCCDQSSQVYSFLLALVLILIDVKIN